MRGEIISIISEGVEDQGVITTIFRAYGFDSTEIRAIRPGLAVDATDRHTNQQTIGTFQGVKNACLGNIDGIRPDFEKALLLENCNNIVIQIDTAEIDSHDFLFVRPQKDGNVNYCAELRGLVIEKIDAWLDGCYKDNLLYAISIEEIEAWCLTAFEKKDTSLIANPKYLLSGHLDRNKLTYKKLKLNPMVHKKRYFEEVTKKMKFHKINKLKEYSEYNKSLKDFISSIEEKFPFE